MLQRLFLLFFTLSTLTACQMGGDTSTYVLIETDFGNMKVRLYDSTPLHRDNFIKLANDGFYKDLLFHRVIEGFMIQGGDPNSRGAAPGQRLGNGGPGYQIPAEINALHIKGALSAARTQNPEKASSGSQFYIVQGKPVNVIELDSYSQRNGYQYTEAQKKLYAELGGTPMLDFEYTVFGEVVEGLEVIDIIASKKTVSERPIEDVKMNVSVIK